MRAASLYLGGGVGRRAAQALQGTTGPVRETSPSGGVRGSPTPTGALHFFSFFRHPRPCRKALTFLQLFERQNVPRTGEVPGGCLMRPRSAFTLIELLVVIA